MQKSVFTAHCVVKWGYRVGAILVISGITLLSLPYTARSEALPMQSDIASTATITPGETEQGEILTSTPTETPAATESALPTFTDSPTPTSPFDVTATQRYATALARKLNAPYFATATAMAVSATAEQMLSFASGVLDDNRPGVLVTARGFVNTKNSIISARFYNAAGRQGYYGIMFRDKGADQQYRIFVNYYGTWQYAYGVYTLASGYSSWIDTSANGYNDLLVVVKDKTALLFINGNFVYSFSLLANKPDQGDDDLFAGGYEGSHPPHQFTTYTNYQVSILP